MNISDLFRQFITDLAYTTWYEYVAVFSGIISVYFSRKENILVYPIGLINTIIYIYISFKGNLLGEATVNFYYTVMSLVGWYMWMKKNDQYKIVLKITSADKKEWAQHLAFFLFFYVVIFFALDYFKKQFFEGVIPWADAFASAAAFTGMWLMTKKKLESWYWWIATNVASIPLYFIKHYVFTSVYYMVLLIMSIIGLIEWTKKMNNKHELL